MSETPEPKTETNDATIPNEAPIETPDGTATPIDGTKLNVAADPTATPDGTVSANEAPTTQDKDVIVGSTFVVKSNENGITCVQKTTEGGRKSRKSKKSSKKRLSQKKKKGGKKSRKSRGKK